MQESRIGKVHQGGSGSGATRAGRDLDMFLEPASIAIIGASDDPTRIGGKTVQNIRKGGFTGPVYPINPRRDHVQGLPTFKSIKDVPGSVDCVVIALPGELVIDAVLDCVEKGVRGIVIFSAGFNEAGSLGAARQERLREIVERSGVRVIGPNCLGAFNSRNGSWLSFTSLFQEKTEAPAIGMISQSGGSAAHMLKLAQSRSLPVGLFLTTGNEADVEFGEGLLAMAEDPGISLIIAYIEGIRNGKSLLMGLDAARRSQKPVLMLKVGRTSAGALAAASHTASLAGEDRVYDAIFRSYGVFRASSTEELLDVAYAATELGTFHNAGRLAVVTISGGMGAQIADAASDAGLSLPPTPEETQLHLKSLCPPGSPVNPVDITAQLSTDPHLLVKSLRLLLESGCYDVLLAFFGVYASVPALSEVFLEDLSQLRKDFPTTPIVLSIVAPPDEVEKYLKLGYLIFEEPARAIKAVATLRRFGAAFAAPALAALAPPSTPRIAAGQRFTEASAKEVLRKSGIPSPEERLAGSLSELPSIAEGMRFPLVLKILSPDILHKTEVGGVELGIASVEEVQLSAAAMERRVGEALPAASLEGFLLSEMVAGGVELILGTRVDPLFGPLLLVGFGGVMAELLQDVSIRLAPVDRGQARAMLEELRSYPLLDGWRGAPPSDVDAVLDAMVALSELAAANADTVGTIEINPLRVLESGRGVFALDAVIETR